MIKFLLSLKERRGMYVVQQDSYDVVVAFLDGYFCACNLYGHDYTQEIRNWFYKETGKRSSQILSYWVRSLNEDLSEKELVEKYIDIHIAFFESLEIGEVALATFILE